jgi:hypothetical protein
MEAQDPSLRDTSKEKREKQAAALMLRMSTISVCPEAQAKSPNLFSSSYCSAGC